MNTVIQEHQPPGGPVIQIVQGDITAEQVDAIINAANEHLQHGGGVARTISTQGGSAIQRESDAWIQQHGPVTHPQPAWTSAGRLPAKYVIHAVGPIWGDGDEDQKLSEAVTGALRVADELNCSSIAMPAISTGIYGFPKERAANVIFSAIETYFENHAPNIKLLKLVLFDPSSLDIFVNAWNMKRGRDA